MSLRDSIHLCEILGRGDTLGPSHISGRQRALAINPEFVTLFLTALTEVGVGAAEGVDPPIRRP